MNPHAATRRRLARALTDADLSHRIVGTRYAGAETWLRVEVRVPGDP